MPSLSFYSDLNDNRNGFLRGSRASASRPLIVNCAGETCLDQPFFTHVPTGRQDFYLLVLKAGMLSLPEKDGGILRP